MVKEENWAIAPERVRAFFAEQPDAEAADDSFQISGCRVILTPVSGVLLGKWAMPRTLIRFEGDERAVEAVYRRFFLRFLSAGG